MKTKRCENPGCNLPPFESKNPQKRFHNLRCKNQAAYLYKKSYYSWEQKLQKARWRNIMILEYLLKQGYTAITKQQLKLVGFDFAAAYLPYEDEQKRTVFRFGNIGMRIVSYYDCEIFNFKTK